VPDLLVATFYLFTPLEDPASMRKGIEDSCCANEVLGTILLANEGINATIAGPRSGVLAIIDELKKDPRLADLTWQKSNARSQPFQRMRVRLKKEIVTLGVPGIDPHRSAGTYVEPEDWNSLISEPDMLVIDTRNDYEVAIGSFENAVNPGVDSFSELTDWLDDRIKVGEQPRVAMFCTGGIRCEKSTALLKERGIEEVHHLRGGILNYLRSVPESESKWNGACFVFDERVAVGHGLEIIEHRLCPRCQYPIGAENDAECANCS
jgi:UPF0176 protein